MGRRNLSPSPFPGKRQLLKELLEHWLLSLASSKPSFLHPACPVRALLPGSQGPTMLGSSLPTSGCWCLPQNHSPIFNPNHV